MAERILEESKRISKVLAGNFLEIPLVCWLLIGAIYVGMIYTTVVVGKIISAFILVMG